MKGIFTHLREKFTSTAPPVESALPPKSNGNNVLVVDDDNAVCRIVQSMLSNEQYQVQTSQSVADALGAIERKTNSGVGSIGCAIARRTRLGKAPHLPAKISCDRWRANVRSPDSKSC